MVQKPSPRLKMSTLGTTSLQGVYNNIQSVPLILTFSSVPRKDKLVFYNSIHSYSQLILLPWGFQQETPDDYDTM